MWLVYSSRHWCHSFVRISWLHLGRSCRKCPFTRKHQPFLPKYCIISFANSIFILKTDKGTDRRERWFTEGLQAGMKCHTEASTDCDWQLCCCGGQSALLTMTVISTHNENSVNKVVLSSLVSFSFLLGCTCMCMWAQLHMLEWDVHMCRPGNNAQWHFFSSYSPGCFEAESLGPVFGN